jgi:hypothetical protein
VVFNTDGPISLYDRLGFGDWEKLSLFVCLSVSGFVSVSASVSVSVWWVGGVGVGWGGVVGVCVCWGGGGAEEKGEGDGAGGGWEGGMALLAQCLPPSCGALHRV